MTGRLPHRTPDGKWTHTSSETAQEEAGLLNMEEYIRRHQNKVAQYIDTQSLVDLFEVSKRSLGGQVGMRWWEQAVLNLAGAREAAEEVAERDGGK